MEVIINVQLQTGQIYSICNNGAHILTSHGGIVCIKIPTEFFTMSPQYKDANIADFFLGVPFL